MSDISEPPDPGPCAILLLDRGRVLVCRLAPHPERAFWFRLSPARVIRRWGTQHGLEQLAATGPLPDTVLDAPAVKDVPWRAILEVTHIDESVWLPHLTPSTEPSSAPPSRTRKGH